MSSEHNYKLLDCDRKAILSLPSGAVHLWLVYYMHESEAGESYLSLRRLELITGWDRKTVIKWRDYLKEHGWLVETGDHASDRYARPTQGSHRVPVVKVDDPNKGSGVIPLPEKSGSGEFLGGKIPPKVSSSLSGSGSGSAFNSPQYGVSSFRLSSGSAAAPLAGEANPLVEEIKTKPESKPEPKSKSKEYAAKDGTPFPEDFFAWTDNSKRIAWLCDHDPGFRPSHTMAEVNDKKLEKLKAEIEAGYVDLLDDLVDDVRDEEVFRSLMYGRPRGEKATPKPKATAYFDDDPCATPGCDKDGIRYAANGNGLLSFACYRKAAGESGNELVSEPHQS
jgi:hypothetical protein